MKCRKIIQQLEVLAPMDYACDWDNPGLLAGRMDKEVNKVYIALDATDEVVEEAVRLDADLLLTHHPLIFRPVKKVNDQDFITRRLVRLIQADISYYAMHTNFDIAPGCMADLAAERLGLLERSPLEVTAQVNGPDTRKQPMAACGLCDNIGFGESHQMDIGIGKTGRLPKPVSLSELVELVKQRFDLPYVTLYGADMVKSLVERIAVSPGSGSSMIRHGIAAGVQVLVTGDIGHHEGLDAQAQGMAVIDAGHYGLEHIFISFMAQYLAEYFPELTVWQAPFTAPVSVM